jgi:quercetin dioxygenase-like cupin family protein
MDTIDRATATAFRWDEIVQDNPIPLLGRQMITGEQMLVARVHLTKGCDVHTHSHVSEQIAVVLQGHVRWTLGAEGSEQQQVEMRGGEVMWLPANVPHAVTALEDTEIIDILSPPGKMGIDHQGGH